MAASPGTGSSGQSDRLDRYEAAADALPDKGRFSRPGKTPTELDSSARSMLNMGLRQSMTARPLRLSEDDRRKLRAERGAGVWRFKSITSGIEWEERLSSAPLSIGRGGSVLGPCADPRVNGQVLYVPGLGGGTGNTDMGITHVVSRGFRTNVT